MANTTPWEWATVNRGLDTNVVGSTTFTRNNWTLIRFRYSDEAYVSELGDLEQTSLSAYNGGVTETILASTITTYEYNFETTRNWVSNSTIWEATGYVYNSQPSYKQVDGTINIPDGSKENVLFAADFLSSYVWLVSGEATPAEVAAGTWQKAASSITNKAVQAVQGGDQYDTYIGQGTFSGNSVFAQSESTTGGFSCTADDQIYDQRSVDWFKQQQTWTYKDGWQ